MLFITFFDPLSGEIEMYRQPDFCIKSIVSSFFIDSIFVQHLIFQ